MICLMRVVVNVCLVSNFPDAVIAQKKRIRSGNLLFMFAYVTWDSEKIMMDTAQFVQRGSISLLERTSLASRVDLMNIHSTKRKGVIFPPLNSMVNSDSSGFTCDTGYFLSDSLTDPCQSSPVDTCPAGKFLQDGSCHDCLTDTFKNDDGPHGCTVCQYFSTSVEGSSECICDAGYSSEDDDTCLACVPGKFTVA